MKIAILICLVFTTFSDLYSNNSDTTVILNNSDSIILKNKTFKAISDTTYDCTVVTGSRSIYKDVNLYGLKDSTLRMLDGEFSEEVHIKDIRTIRFHARGFWRGAAIGGGLGFVLGAIGGADGIYGEGSIGQALGVGIILGVPFALIGGGLGALFADDQFYDLSNLNFETKRRVVGYLLKEYSDK
ncbi:MAG: hypothetical protein IPL53_15525 [Ignavibacteria bacterium]|nr:hypothetical protein [Ignavibacteria bacterium]